MTEPNKMQIWLAQTRANFLLLAVVLTFIGFSLSIIDITHANLNLNIFHLILLLVGNVLAHTSVNLFNEYSDYKTKIDFNTIRNPFSGGSGMLVSGATKPETVLKVAIITMLIALIIGIYFIIIAHWFLTILIVISALTILLYTPFLAKILLGEFFAGMTLGSFVVIGTYIGLVASPEMELSQILPVKVILISIPVGILTSLLLFLNEFPDAEADKEGGRYHLVIALGKKRAAYLYCIGIFLVYGFILIIPILSLSSYFLYLGFLTLPLAIKSCSTAVKYGDQTDKIIPAMGINVLVVLITDLLIGIGNLL